MKDNNLPVKYKESFFKKILISLKNILLKQNQDNKSNNQNYLEKHKENKCKEYRKKSKVNLKALESREELITPESIQYALDQFNASLYFQYENYGTAKPYSALIQLGANATQPSKDNDIKENTLIKTLQNSDSKKQFEVYEQKNRKGDTVFYHVKTAEYMKEKSNKNLVQMRLYINCNRENVAALAGQMLSEMQNDSLYLKFSSDKQLGTVERSEAIVIYTDTKNAPKIINKIEQIHNKEPRLFKNSNNMNPFLKNANGFIGFAPQVETDKYYKADGNVEIMQRSYNNFISKALEQSFVNTAKEYIATSKELTEKTRRNNIGQHKFLY